MDNGGEVIETNISSNPESHEGQHDECFRPLALRDSTVISPRTISHNTVENRETVAGSSPDQVAAVVEVMFWQGAVLRISNKRADRNITEAACTCLIPLLQSIFNDNEIQNRLAIEQAVSTELQILTRHMDELFSPPSSEGRITRWEYEDNERNEVLSTEHGMQSGNALERDVIKLLDALKEINLWNTRPVMFEISARNGRISTRRMIAEEGDTESGEEYDDSEHGLSEEELQLLPCKKIVQEHVEQEMACSTCMDNFQLNEEVRELACQHKFHSNCIFDWLRRKNTCPLCRVVVDANKSLEPLM